MGVVILLLVGVALVASKGATARGPGIPGPARGVSFTPMGSSEPANSPVGQGSFGFVRGFFESAASTQETPQQTPVGSGSGFGFVPVVSPIQPSEPPPAPPPPTAPLAEVTTSKVSPVLPGLYQGISLAPPTSPTSGTAQVTGTKTTYRR